MYVYVYVRSYVYVRIHSVGATRESYQDSHLASEGDVYMCIYMYKCIHMYTYMYIIYICRYTFGWRHKRVFTGQHLKGMCTCACVYTCTCVYQVHVCLYVYVYVCIHSVGAIGESSQDGHPASEGVLKTPLSTTHLFLSCLSRHL